jgi:hypothetical protein
MSLSSACSSSALNLKSKTYKNNNNNPYHGVEKRNERNQSGNIGKQNELIFKNAILSLPAIKNTVGLGIIDSDLTFPRLVTVQRTFLVTDSTFTPHTKYKYTTSCLNCCSTILQLKNTRLYEGKKTNKSKTRSFLLKKNVCRYRTNSSNKMVLLQRILHTTRFG